MNALHQKNYVLFTSGLIWLLNIASLGVVFSMFFKGNYSFQNIILLIVFFCLYWSFLSVLYVAQKSLPWTLILILTFSPWIFIPFLALSLLNLAIIGGASILIAMALIVSYRSTQQELKERINLNLAKSIGIHIKKVMIAYVILICCFLYISLNQPKVQNKREIEVPRGFFEGQMRFITPILQTFIPNLKSDSTLEQLLLTNSRQSISVSNSKLPDGRPLPAELQAQVQQNQAIAEQEAVDRVIQSLSKTFNVTIKKSDSVADVMYTVVNRKINDIFLSKKSLVPLSVAALTFLSLLSIVPFWNMALNAVSNLVYTLLLKIKWISKTSQQVAKEEVEFSSLEF